MTESEKYILMDNIDNVLKRLMDNTKLSTDEQNVILKARILVLRYLMFGEITEDDINEIVNK